MSSLYEYDLSREVPLKELFTITVNEYVLIR